MSSMPPFRVDRERLRSRLIVAQLIASPVGVVILAWLLVSELPTERLRAHTEEVGAALAAGVAGLVLFGVRLRLILRAFGLTLGRGNLWRIHLTSLFYYFFLPAGVGYDLARAAKVGAAAGGVPMRRLAAVVVVERLVGGASLFLLLIAALPFIHLIDDSHLWWLDPPAWVWGGIAGTVALTAVALAALARYRRAELAALLSGTWISVLAYVVIATAIWSAAWTLAVEVSLAEILVALAGTLFFQLIPVNLLGVSFGEVAAVAIYMAYGLDRPDAVLLATLAYLQRLAAAAIGGAVEGAYSGRWFVRNLRARTERPEVDPPA